MRRATTEHAGERGMQLCVDAEMEAYGDQVAATYVQVTNFAANPGWSQAGNIVITYRVVQLARSDRGHLISATTFQVMT